MPSKSAKVVKKRQQKKKTPTTQPSRVLTRTVEPNVFFPSKVWDIKGNGTLGRGRNVQSNAVSLFEPTSFAEATTGSDSLAWQHAMQKEFNSLVDNGTWVLVPLPAGRKAIGCKWVFRVKQLADGSVDRNKARLVAKGFAQRQGLDYGETFSPVIRLEDLRTLLAFAVSKDLEIHQMDVDSAFLNGTLQEKVYMQQPEGFVDPEHPQYVCKLRKSIYGLKQAPRVWNHTIDAYLKSKGYKCLLQDPCIYLIVTADGISIIALYVDDTVLICNQEMLTWTKSVLTQRFRMKDLGEARSILGIELIRDRKQGTLLLRQGGYIMQIVSPFC
jgi:hypothetical protein